MAVSPETWSKMKETRHRLENCWKIDLNWSLYPETLKQVSMHAFFYSFSPYANWIDNIILMLLVLLVYTVGDCVYLLCLVHHLVELYHSTPILG